MIKGTLKVSAAVAVAATLTYQINNIRTRFSSVPTSGIISSSTISKDLEDSRAAKIVNPNKHVPIHDTRYTTIRIHEDLSDEKILADFIRGFFGGHVFGPERSLLCLAKKDITQFNLIREIPISSHIWTTAQLPLHNIPQAHSLLFGVFMAVDSHVEPRSSQKVCPQSHSYIDFAFGSDDGFIAGVHRFSVHRKGAAQTQDTDVGDGKVSVTIEFAHMGCNPRENKPLGPKFLQTLHLWYAMWLFREGIAGVMGLEQVNRY